MLARAQSVARRQLPVRVAFITLIVFGLVESLVRSSAFEILLDLLFILARPVENDAKSTNHALSHKKLAVA